MSKRIVIGISGASGVIYGVRMLSLLREKDFETHLILSEAGKKNIEIETSYKAEEVAAMATMFMTTRMWARHLRAVHS